MAGRIVAYAYLAAAGFFILLPIVVLVVFSFHDGTLPIPPFAGPTWRWYARLLADERLTGGLVNSLLVAIFSSLAACVLGFLAAYGLARGAWRRPGLLRSGLLAPLAVSTLIIGLGMLMTVNALGVPKSLLTWGSDTWRSTCRSPLPSVRASSGLTRSMSNGRRAISGRVNGRSSC